MAQTPSDKTGDKTEPSLELPKLPGFRRRRKVTGRRAGKTGTPEGDSAPATAYEPSSERAPEPSPEWAPEPSSEWAPELVAEQPAEAAFEPPSEAPAEPPTEPEPRPTQQLRVGAEQEPELEPEAALNGAPRRRAKPERSGLALPSVPARLAVVVTGLLVGAAGGAATFGAMAGCKAVRGVSTCGGAPGFFILLAIVVLMILLGGMLLKAFKVSDPGSTSFLAVGVVTVVTMLALLDVIYSPAMFVVIPVLTAAAFLLAHWVTTRFEGEQTGRRDWT